MLYTVLCVVYCMCVYTVLCAVYCTVCFPCIFSGAYPHACVPPPPWLCSSSTTAQWALSCGHGTTLVSGGESFTPVLKVFLVLLMIVHGHL